MGTIADKLNYLNETKEAIKTSIINKGVEVSDTDTFRSYAEKINSIEAGSSSEMNALVATSTSMSYITEFTKRILVELPAIVFSKPPSSMAQIFYQCSNLKKVDVSNFNTSNVTDMSGFFQYCESLDTILGLSNLTTTNVKNMGNMFSNCKELTELDLSNFDTLNVTGTYSMFASCFKLSKLNISNFNTSNVTSFNSMFSSCRGFTELNLNHFDASNVTNIAGMFNGCTKLVTLIVDFDCSKASTVQKVLYDCGSLQNLSFMYNIGKAFTQTRNNFSSYVIDLSYSKQLTHDSLMDVINKLYDLNLSYDVANGGTLYTQQLVLGSTNLAKLTAEEIAIATNKGWTVS